jgi:hypothetical protein
MVPPRREGRRAYEVRYRGDRAAPIPETAGRGRTILACCRRRGDNLNTLRCGPRFQDISSFLAPLPEPTRDAGGRKRGAPSLHGVREGPFPCLSATMRRSDSRPPISPHRSRRPGTAECLVATSAQVEPSNQRPVGICRLRRKYAANDRPPAMASSNRLGARRRPVRSSPARCPGSARPRRWGLDGSR